MTLAVANDIKAAIYNELNKYSNQDTEVVHTTMSTLKNKINRCKIFDNETLASLEEKLNQLLNSDEVQKIYPRSQAYCHLEKAKNILKHLCLLYKTYNFVVPDVSLKNRKGLQFVNDIILNYLLNIELDKINNTATGAFFSFVAGATNTDVTEEKVVIAKAFIKAVFELEMEFRGANIDLDSYKKELAIIIFESLNHIQLLSLNGRLNKLFNKFKEYFPQPVNEHMTNKTIMPNFEDLSLPCSSQMTVDGDSSSNEENVTKALSNHGALSPKIPKKTNESNDSSVPKNKNAKKRLGIK